MAKLGKLIEANAQSKPKGSDLRSWFFFATVQTGVTICIPVFVLGIELGQHMRLLELAPAIFLGGLIVAILASLTGYIGFKRRGPTALIVMNTFGHVGAKVVIGLLALSSFGWFSVQIEMLVHSFNSFLGALSLPTVDKTLAVIVAGSAMSTTAIVGYRALGKVAYVAVPMLLTVVCIPILTGLDGHPLAEILTRPPTAEAYSFGLVVSIVSGTYITGTTLCPDLTRFLRTRSDTVIGAFASLGFAYPLLLVLSATLGSVYFSNDIIEIMSRAGFLLPALIVLFLATWTSNDKNVYEAALSLSVLLPGVPRWLLTAFAGMAGTMLALVGIYDHFISALLFLGIFVSPLAGVYVTDFLIDRGRYMSADSTQAYRWKPFAAWALGIGVGLTTLPASSGGLGLLTLSNVPTLDALLSAAFFHFVVHRNQAPILIEEAQAAHD